MRAYSRFEKVKGGKGFYIALCVCVAAVALSVFGIYYSTKRAQKLIEPQPSDTVPYSVTQSTTLTDEEPADVSQSGVSDERTTETTQQADVSTAQSTTEESTTVKAEEIVYTLPLGTDIIKDYSASTPVYSATMGDWRIHPGIDFAGEEGESVKAVADGKVKGLYSDELWGTVLEIEHGAGVIARYCGLEQGTTVIKDAEVKSGEVIGCLGTIPCEVEDGFHLHLEITKDGNVTDPLEIISAKNATMAE